MSKLWPVRATRYKERGTIWQSNKRRLSDPTLSPARLCYSLAMETLPPPLQTHTHTHTWSKVHIPGLVKIPSSGNRKTHKPVSFSQLGDKGRPGDGEGQQQLLESAWKLLICEHPAGLIQPLHECVCFHTGLLNSFIRCHWRTSGVDK